ncbi:hypothetical protein Ahy_A10g048039 [Arachis hypogaea]|uniref:Uncharacterized protein n=1 Tax=Arachis hypogaea TaxID=3818 RepID=A0A445B444_ARAHY|nr:hypothetical protein Ahy_A10g048039 [Arachis hypogaea]
MAEVGCNSLRSTELWCTDVTEAEGETVDLMEGLPEAVMRFVPNNNACTKEMINIIKLMYDHPWPNYKKIPSETKERWFQMWALHFIWDAKHDLTIRKIYDRRISQRLQPMIDDIRQEQGHLTA